MNKKLLVVAAHPDDEVLGAGGTIAKRVKEGWEASVIFCATGAEGRYATKQKAPDAKLRAELKALEADSKKAAGILGIKKIHRLGFPDNRLDTVSRMDISHAIKAVVEKEKPSVVFTHHQGDYNWDHTIVFDCVLMACRPNAGDFYPQEIYSFEVLSSTERAFQSPRNIFCPNYFVSIDKTLEVKKKALLAYRSEARPYPHPRSAEAVDILAKKRGVEVGLHAAEAFQLIRRVGA